MQKKYGILICFKSNHTKMGRIKYYKLIAKVWNLNIVRKKIDPASPILLYRDIEHTVPATFRTSNVVSDIIYINMSHWRRNGWCGAVGEGRVNRMIICSHNDIPVPIYTQRRAYNIRYIRNFNQQSILPSRLPNRESCRVDNIFLAI